MPSKVGVVVKGGELTKCMCKGTGPSRDSRVLEPMARALRMGIYDGSLMALLLLKG